MPDELWMEVRDIVQETGIKAIPKKNKCKKAKWLSEEALQTAVKREEKSKGEKDRYTHVNAELQRIARRDKKVFFSDQCKEIEENNRMGKTRDLFKEIRDTKAPLSGGESKFQAEEASSAKALRRAENGLLLLDRKSSQVAGKGFLNLTNIEVQI